MLLLRTERSSGHGHGRDNAYPPLRQNKLCLGNQAQPWRQARRRRLLRSLERQVARSAQPWSRHRKRLHHLLGTDELVLSSPQKTAPLAVFFISYIDFLTHKYSFFYNAQQTFVLKG